MKKSLLFLSLIVFLAACNSDLNETVIGSVVQESENTLSINEVKALLQDFSKNSSISSKSDNLLGDEDIEIIQSELKEVSLEIENDESIVSNEKVPDYELITKNGDKTGFSIVVGDRRIPHVIASVEYGSLDDTLFIEPLKMFYRSIPTFIEGRLADYYNPKEVEKVSTKALTVTTHYCFLPTVWGQGYPYNAVITPCMAGCVPIAIAQILAYHRVPSSLNWTNILASSSVTSSSSSTVRSQVSELIANIGTVVGTDCGGTLMTAAFRF